MSAALSLTRSRHAERLLLPTGKPAINRKMAYRGWASASETEPSDNPSLSRIHACRTTDSQKAVVTTAQAVAIVIWLEASAWPVLNCTAIR